MGKAMFLICAAIVICGCDTSFGRSGYVIMPTSGIMTTSNNAVVYEIDDFQILHASNINNLRKIYAHEQRHDGETIHIDDATITLLKANSGWHQVTYKYNKDSGPVVLKTECE